ncbi:MAG: GatB/YqeY domain-containing protein, partial [Microcystaceae cyanobacterium]
MLNTKQTEQILSKTIKKVISDSGIGLSTRKGNKELGLLIKKIAKHPFPSSEDVTIYGEKVGKAIADLSQQKGKKNLDIGVIRQVSFTSSEIAELDKTHPITKQKSSVSAKAKVIVPTQSTKTQVESSPVATEESVEKETTEEAVEKVVEAAQETTEEVSKEATEEEASDNKSLKDRIGEDIKTAMKAKDKVKLETVRSIKKAILEKEVELRPSG